MESHGSSPSHAELPHLFVRDAAVARFLNALLHVVHDATHDGDDGKNDDEQSRDEFVHECGEIKATRLIHVRLDDEHVSLSRGDVKRTMLQLRAVHDDAPDRLRGHDVIVQLMHATVWDRKRHSLEIIPPARVFRDVV